MSEEKPIERTAKALADALEPRLKERNKRLSLICESEDESVLLAHELGKRGWRAKSALGLVLTKEEGSEEEAFAARYFTIVTGRKRPKDLEEEDDD